MGVALTAKVICGSETRDSHAKSIQPGNCEWITAIIAISTSGSILSPQIILAGKKHQSQWYSAIPKEYRISMSDNGWTNDDLSFEWLQEMFEKHTSELLPHFRTRSPLLRATSLTLILDWPVHWLSLLFEDLPDIDILDSFVKQKQQEGLLLVYHYHWLQA